MLTRPTTCHPELCKANQRGTSCVSLHPSAKPLGVSGSQENSPHPNPPTFTTFRKQGRTTRASLAPFVPQGREGKISRSALLCRQKNLQSDNPTCKISFPAFRHSFYIHYLLLVTYCPSILVSLLLIPQRVNGVKE